MLRTLVHLRLTALTVCLPLLALSADVCFTDVASQAGIDFKLDNSPTPEKRLIETMPGGLVIFDYDGDGRPDIFFTNGAAVPSLEKNSPQFANRLFRNEGAMKFRDVTADAGVVGSGYSMGAAAADFDNDGRPDLFVTGVRRNILYRNVGNGRFEDITSKSGIRSDEWTVAAAWLDFDNDGLLDLFLANYGQWDASTERFCGDKAKNIRVYCHPKFYAPRPNQLYRNRGDGTFEDVSLKSGIASHKGRAMGVGIADYDRDGRVDIFVTNDNLPNFLLHNEGSGKFREVGIDTGVALPEAGKPVASMGTDFRDFDNDGWPDIVVVALPGETFPLFRNTGKGSFADLTYRSRLAVLSNSYGGWGAILADVDNDGWKDLFTSNSHVNDLVEQLEGAPYKQVNTLFLNTKNGEFRLADCANLKAARRAHRGTASADFDGDGKLDLVVTSLGEPTELWRNEMPGARHWLVVKLHGIKSNRDGLGAIVGIGKQVNEYNGNTGYASWSLNGVHFGLGDVSKVAELEITWPGGTKQVMRDVAVDQVITVQEQ